MTQTKKNIGFIRMALLGSAFIALTVVLIVYQPGSPRHAQVAPLPEASVTRVAPALDDIVLTVQTPEPITRQEPVLLMPEPDASAALPESTQNAMPTTMRDMTIAAISNLKSAATTEPPAPGEPGSLLHSVVQKSLGVKMPETTSANVATVADQTQNPIAPRLYSVQPGDTLVSIAQATYGDVDMATELFMKNVGLLSRPDNLRPGMILELP